jgi:endonuclease YncB( thermonuclease family)
MPCRRRSIRTAALLGTLPIVALVGCDTATGASKSATTVAITATTSPATTTTMVATAITSIPITATTVAPTTTVLSTTTAAVVTISIARVVDGDTVDLSTGERVRLIGIDTPETGQCGYREATDRLVALVTGQPVTLEAGTRNNLDKYGRLLRYVLVNGVDSGGVLVAEGLAVPRYNSTDGYGAHPREAEYAAEARTSSVCSVAPATTVPATSKPTTATTANTVAKTTAPPAAGVYYANCTEARAAGVAPLHTGDPGYRSGLDRDHDGVACE